MGLAYFRLPAATLEALRPLIEAHEAEIVGPRARGYWFDYPDEYDYEGIRSIARQLDEAGSRAAVERLEISEVQAHALAILEIEMAPDDRPFPPALFLCSAGPSGVRAHLDAARAALGADPARAAARVGVQGSDKRVAGYLKKQVRHLREALPLVWSFYERAAAADEGVLVIDLRARDLFEPDPAERVRDWEVGD